ncbi:MAG: amidohydrolase family protein [Candidatus Gracilibacteria bacterium]|nr:amidohydrolase family protein [Candidatus Gracilibacteria bacterium]
MNTITLRSPSDFHTHLRGYNGPATDEAGQKPNAILEAVCALQSPFAQVLAMPNLLPRHIENADDVDRYHAQIIELLPEGVNPIMTLSLKPTTTPEMIRACAGKIGAVKYYPGGVTTNSGGATGDIDPDDAKTREIFEVMAECGIALSLHPETTVTRDIVGRIIKGFVHRAEREFRPLAERIAEKYPGLTVIIEHISTREMAELVGNEKYPNLYGTVTPQHLLLTAHDKEGSHAFDPHLHCKPTLKDPEDLQAIQKLVYSGCRKVFFGSDSAPHPQSAKECAHCASGVFSSPIALQVVTDWWMSDTTDLWWQGEMGTSLSFEEKTERLQRFFADNGEVVYGKPQQEKMVILEKTPFVIPDAYQTSLSDVTIVPMWAGKEVQWSIQG